MKVVVFGGSGFLGSHTADSLTEKGHEVTIVDINDAPYLKEGQKFVKGSILDMDLIDSVVREAEIVMNFAGIADLDDASTRPRDTITLNILGTCNILEACNKYNVRRFIYASTFYVHSDKGGFYRCSKQATELYIEEFNRKYNLPFTILRYGTLYGPRSTNKNSINRYITQALSDDVIICNGTGNEIREYIHVKDAADLTTEVINEKYLNQHIIITGHQSMRTRDMLNMIKDILGKDVDISYRGIKSETHYNITPFSFKPKFNVKLVGNCYRDMGQGLLESIHDIYEADDDNYKKLEEYKV